MIDPNYLHGETLEWVLPRSEDAVVVGLMLREFGADANPSVYGELVRKVVASQYQAAHYHWTDILQNAFESGSYFVRNAYLQPGRCSVEWHIDSLHEEAAIYKPWRAIESISFEFPSVGIKKCELYCWPWEDTDDDKPRFDPSIGVRFERNKGGTWFELSWGTHVVEHVVMNSLYVTASLHLAPATEDLDMAKLIATGTLSVHLRIIPVAVPIDLQVEGRSATWTIDSKVFNGHLTRLKSIFSPVFCLPVAAVEVELRLMFYPTWSEKWPDYCGCSVEDDSDSDIELQFNLRLGNICRTGMSLWNLRDAIVEDGKIIVSVEVSER